MVVAAGQGSRFGGDVPKQFLPLAGVPVLLRALRPFASHPEVGRVVVVLAPTHVERPPEFLAPLAGAGLTIVAEQVNEQYRFLSDNARGATKKFGVKSISLRADKL